MAFVGLSLTQYANQKTQIFAYFSGTIVTVFGIDILKAWSANKIKKYMTQNAMVNFNKIAGVGIGLFGVFVFVREILLK
jgi:hypothetical protein